MRTTILLLTTIVCISTSCDSNGEKKADESITTADTLNIQKTIADSAVVKFDKELEFFVKEASATKDSIITAINLATKTKVPLQTGTLAHTTLNSTIQNLTSLRIEVDNFIKSKMLDRLKPTNKALKKLVKDISDQKDKLEGFAKKITTISSVVKIVTNIVASSIFKDVQPQT